MKRGLFVLAHGSRAKEADETLKGIVETLNGKDNKEFQLLGFGSMEFSKPSFGEGIEDLVKQGAEEIVIVPMFLFRGNHIQFDIPKKFDQIKEQHPDVKFIMGQHIGADNRIAEIIEERGREALQPTI
ncbi:MAG: CbiX/SirB N-terminal domain-containing protein [Clostridiaceae bacterium]|nr:CbiX/SirB N-terminal domain-containing protein [Clostridiaceae bacterium]